MRFGLIVGVLGCAVLAGSPTGVFAEEVSLGVRDGIEDKLSPAFLSPQTTLWRFDSEKPYVSGKRVVCGWVNFQSAQQTYVGYHQFYAMILDGQVILAQIDDPVSDTSGELAVKLKALCGEYKRPG